MKKRYVIELEPGAWYYGFQPNQDLSARINWFSNARVFYYKKVAERTLDLIRIHCNKKFEHAKIITIDYDFFFVFEPAK